MSDVMRYLAAWALFLAGDAVSRLDSALRRRWSFYRPYNWLMLRSADIQGEGPGPWGPPEEPGGDDMESIGFVRLAEAPADILGKPLTLLHWAGATEAMTFQTKDEAATAYKRGWTRYRLAFPTPTSES